MALHNILVRAHPKAVWDVLADPYSYDQWVMGTRKILDADAGWPEVGSSLRFEAGFGPLRMRSETVVRDVDAPRRLELEADVWPLGARVAMDVKAWGPTPWSSSRSTGYAVPTSSWRTRCCTWLSTRATV